MEHSREQVQLFLVFQKDFLSAACEGHMRGLRGLSEKYKFGESYALMRTHDGCNALHLAAYHGRTEACRFLMEELKFDVNCPDNGGDTPLFQAIWKGHWPTAEFLVENGADVNRSNSKGSTPLHYAAKRGSEEIVALLLSKGADIYATSLVGMPLHSAAKHGNAIVMKSLLDRNENPNSISPLQMSPLLMSMNANSIKCMELLLKAGANPDGHGSKIQTTPLCWAASKPNLQMIQCLLKHKANPDVLDHKGKKAIEYAAMANCLEVVEYLFPNTKHIASFPEWSVSGIMQHARSKQAEQKELSLQAKAMGNEAFERGKFSDAIHWYTQALEADRYDAKVVSNRSLCWANLKEGSLALIDAENCIELDSTWPKGHYRLGVAWNILKFYKKAAKAFSRALDLDPGNKEIEEAYREAQAELDNAYYSVLI